MHAVSLDSCLLSTAFRFMKPSVAVDHILKENPRRYEVLIRIIWMSLCINQTETFFVNNGTITEGTENKTAVILPSSCSDCVVLKSPTGLMLLSRNTSVGAADLKQFETQSTCAGFIYPLHFKSNYDFKNCNGSDFIDPDNADLYKERGEEVLEESGLQESFLVELFKCGQEEYEPLIQKIRNFST